MRLPIRFQFMAPLAVVALASLVTVAVVNHRRATQQTRDRVQTQLRGVASVLTQRTYPLTEIVLRQMAGLANAEFVLTDAAGNAITSSSPALAIENPPAADAIAEEAGEVVLGDSIAVGSTRYFHSAVWVKRNVGDDSRSVLHILFPQRDYDAEWRSAFLPPFAVGLATIAALGIVIHLVAGRVSRVLSDLGQEVSRLSCGDFSDVEQPRLQDETQDLAASINETARRLRDYENDLKRSERLQTVAMIGAGLAHEMRNAVTGCRLAIDLHAQACGEESAEGLEVARRQLILMENRLQQLLRIGREPEESQRRVVDLSAVVEECIDLVRPAANHKRVAIEWEANRLGAAVEADPELVGQAVTNVLLNALDAAARQSASANRSGRVVVEIGRADSDWELLVRDNGAGPEEPDRDVFEPFVTEKPEGVGLGLAVAKRIVSAHGGGIDYYREEGFTVFRIRLPLAKAEACHA